MIIKISTFFGPFLHESVLLYSQQHFWHIIKYGIPGNVLRDDLFCQRLGYLFIVYNTLRYREKNIGCLYYISMPFLLATKQINNI